MVSGLHVFQASLFEARLHNLVEESWYYWDESYRIPTGPFKSYEIAFAAWKQSIQINKLACSTGGCED